MHSGASPHTKGSTTARSSNIEPSYSARRAAMPPTVTGTASSAGPSAAPQLRDERRELAAHVVPDDDFSAFQLLGELLDDVVMKWMHQRAPPSAAAFAARRPRPRPPFALATGASSRLFSAALTAIEVRSRTSSSTGRVGVWSWLPLAVIALDPENILKPVGDGEAAVSRALWNDALGPEVHCEVRPVVLRRQ